ncbi:hypothetical protein [Clostridium culturomicium]|uniref:hypothetical protein n=1 Tax=Clostridium culturomicium TaxID=1499683 RepID=UPI003857F15C
MKITGKVINFDEEKVYIVTDTKEFVTLERNEMDPIKGRVYTGIEYIDRTNQVKIISIIIAICVLLTTTLYFIFFSATSSFIVTIDGNTKVGVNNNKIISVTDVGDIELTNEQFTSIKGNEVNDGLILLFDLAYKQEILPPQDFWSMGKIHIYVTKDKGEEPIDFTKFKEYAYQFNYEVIVNRNNNTFD